MNIIKKLFLFKIGHYILKPFKCNSSLNISDSKNSKSCVDRCIPRSDFNFTRFEIVGSRVVIIGETEVRIYNPDILFENKIKLETNSNAKFDCSRKSYSFRLHKNYDFGLIFMVFD